MTGRGRCSDLRGPPLYNLPRPQRCDLRRIEPQLPQHRIRIRAQFRRHAIELAAAVVVKSPDLTIAAQSAPGAGVCLKGSALSIEADNVIVRGLRSRSGDGPIGDGSIGPMPEGVQPAATHTNAATNHVASRLTALRGIGTPLKQHHPSAQRFQYLAGSR